MRMWLLVLCGVSLGGPFVSAQNPIVPAKLSLADAVRIAFVRNPSLAAVRGDVDIAEADRLDASRRLNPAFTVESEGYHSSSPRGRPSGTTKS